MGPGLDKCGGSGFSSPPGPEGTELAPGCWGPPWKGLCPEAGPEASFSCWFKQGTRASAQGKANSAGSLQVLVPSHCSVTLLSGWLARSSVPRSRVGDVCVPGRPEATCQLPSQNGEEPGCSRPVFRLWEVMVGVMVRRVASQSPSTTTCGRGWCVLLAGCDRSGCGTQARCQIWRKAAPPPPPVQGRSSPGPKYPRWVGGQAGPAPAQPGHVNPQKVATSGELNLEHLSSRGCLSLLVWGTPHTFISFLQVRGPPRPRPHAPAQPVVPGLPRPAASPPQIPVSCPGEGPLVGGQSLGEGAPKDAEKCGPLPGSGRFPRQAFPPHLGG